MVIKKIAIVGIGGVGGYIGSKLCLKNSLNPTVFLTFIVRHSTYDKILSSGLELEYLGDIYRAYPDYVFKNIEDIPKQDIIIICVKHTQLSEVLTSFKGTCNEGSTFLTLLNGVENERVVKDMLPDCDIVEGSIFLASYKVSSTRIKQVGGYGSLQIASKKFNREELIDLKDIFEETGIKVSISDNLESMLWEKYIYSSSVSCITSAYSINIQNILTDRSLFFLLKELMNEVILLAKKKGVILPSNILARSLRRLHLFQPSASSSMRKDLEQNRPSEFNILLGYVLSEASKLKIKTPNYTKIYKKINKKYNII